MCTHFLNKRLEISSNMKINCEFRKGLCAIYLNQYTCVVTSAAAGKPNDVEKRFSGVHMAGMSDENVEAIKFEDVKFETFPRGLHKVFPKLTSLLIKNCGLKNVSRKDLAGLENLTGFGIFSNHLTTLPNDLFVDMQKLRNISFIDNKLEFLSSKLLMPIVTNDLKYVDFRNNTNINSVFGLSSTYEVDSIKKLMEIIDKNCSSMHDKSKMSPVDERLVSGCKELWESKMFSDFVIKSESQNFPVHRNVLSMQSRIFKEILEAEIKESGKNELMIQGCSANTVGEFLRYIYTGEEPSGSNAMELFALCSKYEITELKSSCEENIVEEIDETNAFEVLNYGHIHSSEIIKKAAFKEIRKMFSETFLSEDLMEKPDKLKELYVAKHTYVDILQNISK